MLPDRDGFAVCRELRRTSTVPVIMVTARTDSHDVVGGLEAGADDYVTKPLVAKELTARIRALLRRVEPAMDRSPRRVDFGDLSIGLDDGVVLLGGVVVPLTRTEFRLLVELAVADTGSGMTDDVRSRAIEPFFTTKPTGVGTGLGLSQVYGVVRESGGTLAIDSEPGRGTTVRLILQAGTPPTVRTEEDSQSPPTVPGARPRDQTRVLVVDDDRLVRRLMTDGLRSLQYQVTACENGEQALETLDRERFDLLLVDFAMPGMNGADVASAAQNRQPGIKVLMVSGYADSAAVEATLGSARLLRKARGMHAPAPANASSAERWPRRWPIPLVVSSDCYARAVDSS